MSLGAHKILQTLFSHGLISQELNSSGFAWESSTERELQTASYAIFISMLIHLLVIALWQGFNISVNKVEEQNIEVRLIRETVQPRIVPESQAEEKEPLEPTLNRASKSTATKVETHRKGEVSAVVPKPSVTKQEKKLQKKSPTQQTKDLDNSSSASKIVAKKELKKDNSPKLEPILSLGANELQRSLNKVAKQGNRAESSRDNSLRAETDYTPFRRSLSPAVSGRIGSPDYLPTIQDGEINLLNAKADRYAVFVRRVALQVFGILRRMSWSSLSSSQISRLQEFSEVRAIISPKGELIRVEYGASSGLAEFDSLLNEAVKLGAWDKNPPSGAQMPDGNIHFVFRARSWSRLSPSGIGEQRWLLLSSGLL